MKSKQLMSAAAVLAVIPATAALATSGDAATRTNPIVHVVMKQTAMKLVDAAPTGDSPGDVGIISGDLLAPQGHRKTGRYQGYCVLVAPATGNSECTFTLKLPAGQVTILGGYGKGINTDTDVHEAVIGGTGAYRDARGQTTGRETSNTTVDVRIALAG